MSKTLYWLWLAGKDLLPRIKYTLLCAMGSPEAIYNAKRDELARAAELKPFHLSDLCDKDLSSAKRHAEICQKLSIAIVPLGHADYPDRLRQIADPPVVLFMRGTLPNLEESPGLAIVGTCKASSYGLKIAENMARGLAEAGFVVVSGMAEGIDGAANRGALSMGEPTVAVMGCGLDRCYPSFHQQLMHDIVQSGAVISEYPPGAEPIPSHFPARNRIISGLCVGTLLVEAPKRSGALITARDTLEQGRDLFIVPGNVDMPSFAGSNQMLASGEGYFVVSPIDILREYTGLLENEEQETRVSHAFDRAPVKRDKTPVNLWEALIPQTKPDLPAFPVHLSADERAIAQAVQGGAQTVDTIVAATKLAAGVVTASITMLELDGVLRREQGQLRLSAT